MIILCIILSLVIALALCVFAVLVGGLLAYGDIIITIIIVCLVVKHFIKKRRV